MDIVTRIAIPSSELEEVCAEAFEYFPEGVYETGITIDSIVCQYLSVRTRSICTWVYAASDYDNDAREIVKLITNKHISNQGIKPQEINDTAVDIYDGILEMDADSVGYEFVSRLTNHILKIYKNSNRDRYCKDVMIKIHNAMTVHVLVTYGHYQ